MRASGLTLAFALAVSGCAGGRGGGDPDAGSTLRCAADTDCSDGADCTLDTCGVSGICEFTPIDARCETGESCVIGRGCVSGTTCTSREECDDAIDCTVDSCGVGGTCRHMALNELCSDPMTPECDTVMGCIRGSTCTSGADCDDAIDCTNDTCGPDMRCRHEPLMALCEMGQMCSPTMGCFTPRPCDDPSDCQDDDFCNGAELCVPEFGCAPAEGPRVCNDSDACTIDSCDATLDMCVFACDRSMSACSSRPGCETPAAGCTGTFEVTGGGVYTCRTILGSTVVNVDLSRITLSDDGAIADLEPRRAHFTASLAGAAMCPMLDVSHVVSGGCEETYRFTATFTDEDHFTGTLEIRFVNIDGSCEVTDCADQTYALTGTRM